MSDERIWKFPLARPGDFAVLEVPEHGACVHVGPDPDGRNSLWMRVFPNAPLVQRVFMVVGTGHPFSPSAVSLGSFIDGRFVWHVLELRP